MRMAQNYRMTANFHDGFDAAEAGKSCLSPARSLPHMRQNYRLT